jgi:hypothetical protein
MIEGIKSLIIKDAALGVIEKNFLPKFSGIKCSLVESNSSEVQGGAFTNIAEMGCIIGEMK